MDGRNEVLNGRASLMAQMGPKPLATEMMTSTISLLLSYNIFPRVFLIED